MPHPNVSPNDDLIFTEAEETGQGYDGPPIPVHIASEYATRTAPVAPEFTSCNIFSPVAQIGVSFQPTMICPRRIRRYKCAITIRGGAAASDTYINTNREALMIAGQSPPNGTHMHLGAAAQNTFPDYYGQQPLWVVSTQPDVEINVMDMSYAEPEETDVPG